jgi:hypothetical protein
MLSIRYVTFEPAYIAYLLREPEHVAELPFMTVIGMEDWDLSSRGGRVDAAIAVESMRSYLQKSLATFLKVPSAVRG